MDPAPLTFTVEVTLSDHDALRRGQTATSSVTVDVLAETEDEATLIAAQMAAIRGRMPTSTTVTAVAA